MCIPGVSFYIAGPHAEYSSSRAEGVEPKGGGG
jgi:hypothetical protein